MALRVAFVDMWRQFNPQHNFFVETLRQLYHDVAVVTPDECDLLIYSVFGDRHTHYEDKFRLYYTGENTRPPDPKLYNKIYVPDASISFDFDSVLHGNFESTNYRLPVWYQYIDWFNVESWYGPNYWLIPPDYIDQPNEFSAVPKTKFCAAVFAKFARYRMETAQAFQALYKPIDIYGPNAEQQILIPPGDYAKCSTLAHYKFSMCYENSSYPGYVTEKLLQAKVANTVPIYWGNKLFSVDFNPQCCLFFDGDYETLVDRVRRLDEDDDAYAAMLAQPLFLHKPNVTALYKIFRYALRTACFSI